MGHGEVGSGHAMIGLTCPVGTGWVLANSLAPVAPAGQSEQPHTTGGKR
jgi:hypothetical protein